MTTQARPRVQAIAIPGFGRGAGWAEHEDGGGYGIGLNFDGRWGYGGPGPREVADMAGIAAGYRVRKHILHGDVDWVLTYNGTDTRVYRVETGAWANKSGSRFTGVEGVEIISFGDVVAVGFGTAQAYEFSSDDAGTWTASISSGNAKYITRAMVRQGGLANPRVDYVVDPDELYQRFDLTNSGTPTTASTIGDSATDQDYFTSLTETATGTALIGKRRALWSYDSDGLAVKLTRDYNDPPADAGGQGDRRNFEAWTQIESWTYYVVEGYEIIAYSDSGQVNERLAPKHSGPLIPRMDLPINALTHAGEWLIAFLGSKNTATLKSVTHAPGGTALLQNTFGTTSDMWAGRYQQEGGQTVFVWHGVLLETTDPLRYAWFREDDGYLYMASGDSESGDQQQRRCYFPIEAPATHTLSGTVTLQTGTWRVELGRMYPGGGPLEPGRLVEAQLRTVGLASSTPSIQMLHRVAPDHEATAYTSLVTWTSGADAEYGCRFPPFTVGRSCTIDIRGAGNSGSNLYAFCLGGRVLVEPYSPPGIGKR